MTFGRVLFSCLLLAASSATLSQVPARITTNTGPGEWNDPAGLCTEIEAYWKWNATQPGSKACGTVDIIGGCPAWPQVNATRTIRPWFKNASAQCVDSQTYSQSWIGSCKTNSTYTGNGVCTCTAGKSPGLEYCWSQFDPPKNYGCPDCNNVPNLIGNPANPGTGGKYHAETIYRGSGPFPLALTLSYNSRIVSEDFGAPWKGAFGALWSAPYQQRVKVYTNGSTAVVAAAGVKRPDGKELRFTPPAAGNVYVVAADVQDRLTKLVDGAGALTGWRYDVAADETVEIYDAAGRLVSVTNRDGFTHTLAYTGTQLTSVSDPMGRSLTFAYDGSGRATTMTDPSGGQTLFAYDGTTSVVVSGQPLGNNLTRITWPDAKFRLFHYNEQTLTSSTNLPNHMTGITDEKAVRFATYTYSSWGGIKRSELAGGINVYAYNLVTGGPTTVTDPLGKARTFTLQSIHGVMKNTGVSEACGAGGCGGAGGKTVSFDANGNISSRTDWNDNRTNYGYDLARNLETSRTEALTAAGATTLQTRTITTEWHSSFRLPSRLAEPLRITTFTYDPDGTACGARGAMCAKSIQATTDANGSQAFSATPSGSPRAWVYTYNAHGSVLTVNGPRTDVADTTTYGYYASNASCPTADGGHATGCRGQIETIANALSQTTTITAYNGHGQPLRIVDPNGLVTLLGYDARQRLTSRTVGAEVTAYAYDNVGQLTQVLLPDGSYLGYTYDNAQRLTEIADNLGNRIVYTLDAMGNRTAEAVRDPANQLAQTRSRVYSNLNRLFQELGATSQTTEYGYDTQGNVLTVKDPLNRVTTNQYDALNRLKQVTSPTPISAVTQYGYDGLDQLVSVTDPRSLVTTYSVNGLGDLGTQVSPDTGTTANTHDAAGNLLTQIDAKSQTTTYTYDALNRVTLLTFHDNSAHAFGYDSGTNGIGRLTSITETDASAQQTHLIEYDFDQHGRVVSDTRTLNGITYTTGYRYDSSGRLDRITYPSGRSADYSFDALGRISAVSTTPSGGSAQSIALSITYHPFGGVKGFTFGNGQTYARAYDLDGRIASYTLAGTSYTVGYDAASRITAIGANTYGYDALDRLTSAILPSTTFGYSYDAVGNRLTKTEGPDTQTLTYVATSNRIATLTPASGPARSFTLDPNGSTTADSVNNFTYDARGRMVRAVGSFATDYQVNALGQRVRKTNSQDDRVFLYGFQGHLVAEATAAGATLKEYVWLGDTPLAIIDAAGAHFIHVDHLSSPRLITNASGQPMWRWENTEPFGVNVPDENPSGLGVFDLPLRLPGQYFDKETNLYYNYQRDAYDAVIGRFTQPEPIGLAGDINLYRYARNDPLIYIDRDGRSPTTAAGGLIGTFILPGPGTLVGAGIGTAIGVGIGWWALQSSSSDAASNVGSSSTSGSQQNCPAPCVPPEGTKCWVKGTGRSHAGHAEHWDIYEMQRRRSDNVCFWAYRGGRIGIGVLVTPPPADMSPCSTYPNFTPRPPHAPR